MPLDLTAIAALPHTPAIFRVTNDAAIDADNADRQPDLLLTALPHPSDPADIVTCYDCLVFHARFVTHYDPSCTYADDLHFLCTPCRNAIFL